MDETIKQIKAYFLQCTRINAVWFSDRTVMSVKGLGLEGLEREGSLKMYSNLQATAVYFNPGATH